MLKLSLCLALLGLSQCWRDERARVVRDYLHYTGWFRVIPKYVKLAHRHPVRGLSNGSGDKMEHFIIKPQIYINYSLTHSQC